MCEEVLQYFSMRAGEGELLQGCGFEPLARRTLRTRREQHLKRVELDAIARNGMFDDTERAGGNIFHPQELLRQLQRVGFGIGYFLIGKFP